jgi:hypothetical protein
MFPFLLTAREGRVSADHLGCSVIAPFPDAATLTPTRAAPFVCLAPTVGEPFQGQNRQYWGHFMSAITVVHLLVFWDCLEFSMAAPTAPEAEEMKPCDTAADRLQWVLLAVHASRERKIADGLRAKGHEVFLPMHTVRRQWSDRVKTYDAPLFPGQLFCRFSSILAAKRILAVTTPDVVLAKPMPIPELEIERLRRIVASQYPLECCALPQIGEIVEIPGDIAIRGVLVERDSVCRVAIGFDVMGCTVVLRVPLVDLKGVEGPLTPPWPLTETRPITITCVRPVPYPAQSSRRPKGEAAHSHRLDGRTR